MKRIYVAASIAVLLLGVAALAQEPASGGQRAGQLSFQDWERKLFGAGERPASFEGKAPVKLFDNLYSVGLQTISPYLITTSAGLVLIDTTWADTVDMVLDNIRKVGLNPADIRYVIITHALNDHYGGAGRIKQVAPGVRIVSSLPDWQQIEQQMGTGQKGRGNLKFRAFQRDLVIEDGQSINLGDTTFKFYVTPGRTPGALSIEYPVRDGAKTYRALSSGGLAIFPEPKWGIAWLASMERLRKAGPWDVLLPNHPFMVLPRDLAEIEKDLPNRGSGPHPAVAGPAAIDAWFEHAIAVGREKVASEPAASK